MHVDMCSGMRADMRTDICKGMRVDMHIGMRVSMRVSMCLGMCGAATGSLLDEKFRVQEADIDFTLVHEVNILAQEQVELPRDHQWNDDNERALMVDRRHTQRWNEAEQLHLWDFYESEAA